MVEISDKNAQQLTCWGGRPGLKWVEQQEQLERLYLGVTDAIIAAAALRPGERVLDIGCGTGDSSFAALRQVGPTGHVLGADISAPMLGRARERIPAGAPIEFVDADATLFGFPPADADILISRFGVMFFAEPEVAFANIRRGLKAGGRVAFACWQALQSNPYFMVPLEAAYAVMPRPPQQPAGLPGPFAFADETRVRQVLGDAGFADVALHPTELALDVADGRGLDAAVQNALEIGPTSRLVAEQAPDLQQRAASAIRGAYAARQSGDSVPLDAAVWIVTAINPG